MALQTSINNPYDGISENAYIKLETTEINRLNKRGYIKFVIFNDKKTRDTVGKSYFDAITIWINELEIVDNKLLRQLGYNSIYDKTTEEIYNKVKLYNVISEKGNNIDLSIANNV